jgi:phosphoribosylaminoimidazolecarboxamide formyltransferase / IMP cyclohydrolase
MVKTALISVSDKTGLLVFASELANLGFKLISTGGTAKTLRAAGLAVIDVSDITGFPEIMDGRVKTLHPKVHGALLSVRGNAEHEAAQVAHGIGSIDLLVVNLYPFEQTVASGASDAVIIENIDIGGPAMIRAAAKNHASLTVVVDTADYQAILAELKQHGNTAHQTRTLLAAKAFARTSAYDAAIAMWFNQRLGIMHPDQLSMAGHKAQMLRYGENPHQIAAVYRTNDGSPGILDARQMQGKDLSYNNINDADAALECISEFPADESAACVIVKHANPCGVAMAKNLAQAYRKALACDPVSAFGGIIAFNKAITAETAMEVTKLFAEVILAPAIDEDARAILATKKNLRLLLVPNMPDPARQSLVVKSIAGGLLVQSRDHATLKSGDLRSVGKRPPTQDELTSLRFAMKVAKHVKSNAIVFAEDGATVGIGAGQMSRIDAIRIAISKSEDAARAMGLSDPLVKGAVLASDAFFPFPDGIEAAAAAGVTAVIQPGGAMKDDDVIAAANRLGLAMVFTGQRHFRH